MSTSEPTRLMAGTDFPWQQISGFYLRLNSFLAVAEVRGDRVGSAVAGAFGFAIVELPNPDVEPEQRLITLPVQHKSDYKSLFRAQLDAGVRNKTNELVVVYEHRRGFLGGKRACLHVAAYSAGTWKSFFDAVDRYASKDFHWPTALFLYQPSNTQIFPASGNIFAP
ncbi:MAG TPA: hypothetical protein VIK28_03940 [Sedimentisphaerales bacterium]|jgi:hypothetical protein